MTRTTWCANAGALLAASLFSLPAYAQETPLRIEDAVQLALARNETAKIADEQILVADAAVEKARVLFLPTIVATAADTLRPATKAAPSNAQVAAGTFTQPLLNASAWPLYRQAERLQDAQRATSTDTKRLLAFSAANQFLQALQIDQVLEAAKRRADSARANLSYAQARVDAQLNSSNDVTRAQLDLANAEQEVETDVGTVKRAHYLLSFILNTPYEGPLTPPTSTLGAAAIPVADVDHLIALGEMRRLDLVASKHQSRAAHLFAEEPLLRLVPIISLGAAVTGNSASTTGHVNDETLTATATWTIYDAGNRYADKHSRDATARIADLQEETLVRSIGNDVRTAASTLAAAQAAFRASEGAVTAARKSLDETSTLYRQGLARAIEVTDANDSRFLAEVAYVSNQFSMALAYLALRQSMGLDPLGTVLQ